jgi:hypothetical protein
MGRFLRDYSRSMKCAVYDVMAGLVPAIHVFAEWKKDVDARMHDVEGGTLTSP